jgi:hypothetical protein
VGMLLILSLREMRLPPHCTNATVCKKGKSKIFFQWSLYTAHHDRGMVFGDHSKMEVLFEIKTICQSGKAAKNG